MSERNSPPALKVIPHHVAIIMDGNGRWAKKRFLPRLEGHRAGARTVRMVVEESRRLGVRYLTLYAFSTENWQRPADEVSSLMRLFEHYLKSELETLLGNDIRLRAIGDLERLPASVRELLYSNEERTKHLSAMQLVLAVSYGSRDELVRAARLIAADVQSGCLTLDQISEQSVTQNLYAPDIPDPDLLIRTSDEFRISNFLLWQLAYSELVISKMLWPEFSREEYQRCLAEFAGRERRFGRTGEQSCTPSSAESQADCAQREASEDDTDSSNERK